MLAPAFTSALGRLRSMRSLRASSPPPPLQAQVFWFPCARRTRLSISTCRRENGSVGDAPGALDCWHLVACQLDGSVHGAGDSQASPASAWVPHISRVGRGRGEGRQVPAGPASWSEAPRRRSECSRNGRCQTALGPVSEETSSRPNTRQIRYVLATQHLQECRLLQAPGRGFECARSNLHQVRFGDLPVNP